ncbi:cupin domain-containing protein [Candidatus Bathyarchaeota archaeon]|nr:cupin domain-containing protein [Candidatus Bathyarchaeota archaeon]
MIVRRKNEGKEIPVMEGVKFTLLQNSDRMMLILVEIAEGSIVPMHSHVHEQMGMCLKGSAEFESDIGVTTVGECDSYFLASNEKHMVRKPSRGGAVFLDIFSPPREDYISKLGDQH